MAIVLLATLSACTGGDDDPRLRHADAVAQLGDGAAQGEFIVNGDFVVVLDGLGDGQRLTGYDIGTGDEQWSMPMDAVGYVWLGTDFFAFQPDRRHVEIRELGTGKLRHEIELKPDNDVGVEASLAGASSDTVFVTSPKGDRHQELSALDAQSGTELWTYQPNDNAFFTGVRPVGVDFGTASGPTLGSAEVLRSGSAAPVVAVADLGSPGELTALDVDSGDERWTIGVGKGDIRWPGWSGAESNLVTVVTAIDESTSETTLTAVQADQPEREQVTVEPDVYDDEKRQWRSPAEDEWRLIVREGFLFAQTHDHNPQVTDLRTGYPVWTAKHEGEPLAYGDGIAVYQRVGKDGAGEVYATDGRETLWHSDTVAPDRDAVMVDGQLLVGGEDGVEVYDAKTGEAQWRFRGTLLGWNDDFYVFKKTENDQAVKVVARDGE